MLLHGSINGRTIYATDSKIVNQIIMQRHYITKSNSIHKPFQKVMTASLYPSLSSLFLASLLGGLGDLAGTALLLLDGLDDTDSDGLLHVLFGG